MIKLIVSDLDGTLLRPDGTLPTSFFPVLEKLHAKGAAFAVATGRQIVSCEKLFSPAGPLANSVYFITQNGSCLYQNGVQLHHQPLPKPLVEEVLATIQANLSGVTPILFTSTYGYISKDTPAPMQAALAKAHVFCKTATNLQQIAQTQDIVRITLRDEIGTSRNGYPLLFSHYSQLAEVTMANELWMDLVAKGVHKGAAIATLQHQLAVTKAETLAFGDYHNDITLLQQAQYSYAMENACPEAKQAARFACPSNQEKGVEIVLKNLLQQNLNPNKTL